MPVIIGGEYQGSRAQSLGTGGSRGNGVIVTGKKPTAFSATSAISCSKGVLFQQVAES
jgi:hypothetical protein